MQSRQRGVTIVELLIVVVIVGILAAIAFPSYQSQLRKGSRAAAQAEMLKIANREAQFLLDQRNYAVGPTALATLTISLPKDVTGMYDVTIVNAAGGTTPATPPSFTIKATPIAGGRQVPDGELTLTHDGAKTRAGNPGWQ